MSFFLFILDEKKNYSRLCIVHCDLFATFAALSAERSECEAEDDV